jgi:hypothetical protein
MVLVMMVVVVVVVIVMVAAAVEEALVLWNTTLYMYPGESENVCVCGWW